MFLRSWWYYVKMTSHKVIACCFVSAFILQELKILINLRQGTRTLLCLHLTLATWPCSAFTDCRQLTRHQAGYFIPFSGLLGCGKSDFFPDSWPGLRHYTWDNRLPWCQTRLGDPGSWVIRQWMALSGKANKPGIKQIIQQSIVSSWMR